MKDGEREAIHEESAVEDSLVNPAKAGTDWFTKLAKVERAKAIRREAKSARRGKAITFFRPSSWTRSR